MNTLSSIPQQLPPRHQRQRGLTLIELMVAITIGLILTAGVIQIFIGSNQTYRFQESMSRIQENGRFGVETIARSLRNADYRGCLGRSLDDSDTTDLTGGPGGGGGGPGGGGGAATFDFSGSIQGHTNNGGWSPPLDGDIAGENPSPDGDVLRVRSAAAGGASDVSPPEDQSGGSNLFVDDTAGFSQNETVIATSCSQAVRFNIQNNPGTGPGQLTVPGNPGFYGTYEPDEVYSSGLSYFYIAGGSIDNEPALFQRGPDGTVRELVEGVERMALQFGEDTNGDTEVNAYRTADNVSDWESVVAVRVSLLLRGREDNVTDEPQTISFPPGAAPQTVNDRRLRQVFTTTTSLRNRLE